jgi:DNA-binding winged helix-turn-helix (wHTH) protein/tetratricopeptide (TPR) repeat protein
MGADEVYEFGEFVLDVSERRLSRNSNLVPMAPKAYDLLVVLVRHAGRLVTKQELLDAVWPDAFVEEGVLAVHMSSLRKALNDRDGDRRHIETVPRAGYRFTTEIRRRPGWRTDDRWRLASIPVSRPEVYELIGRGRSHLLTASMREIPRAVDAFKDAIRLDPTYAAGHAGLALACCAQAELRIVAHGDAYADARASALRALAMDSSNADAQLALGTVLFLSEWNWTGARRSIERALELSPDHPEAHLTYGRLLDALGDLDRGLAAKQKALERDPDSPRVTLEIALSYWNQRRYDDVIAWATRALGMDPRHLLAREYLAGAYLMKGDHDRHLAESITHGETHGVPADLLTRLKETYARGGRAGVVRYALESSSKGHRMPEMQLALLHGEAGEMDEAFRHLSAAIDGRDPSLVYLAVAPQWDVLREDPRFDACLDRMGLR